MNEDFTKGVEMIIHDVEFSYVYLDPQNPDTKYGAEWSVTVKLDDKRAKEYKKAGFNVRDDGSMKIKKKAVTANGKQQAPPIVVGLDGRTQIEGSEVGPGSRGNVKAFCKIYKDNIVSAFINAVQVTDLKQMSSGFEDLSNV